VTVAIVIAITVAYLGTLGTIVVLLGGRISALEAAVNVRLGGVEAAVTHLSEAVGELRGRIDTLERTR
jgi:hypothetical protein